MLGRFSGTFGEPLHLLGHHGEAAAGFTRRRRLDRRIQRQHVGLFRDIGNQLHDFTDFLRAFAEAFDAFGGFLDLLADVVHAAYRILHRLGSLFRGAQGAFRDLGRLRGIAGYVVDVLCNLQH